MANNLWSLVFGQDGTLPVLIRTGSNVQPDQINYITNTVYSNLKTYADDINVVTDFPWTKSPKSSRLDVPRLVLKEKRIKTNSTISNFAYSINTVTDIAKTAGKVVNAFGTKIGSGENASVIQKTAGAATAAAGTVISDTATAIEDVSNTVMNAVADDYENFGENSVLTPYNGLYRLEKTGFKYIFPYLDDNYRELETSLGDAGQQNIISDALSKVNDMGSQAAGALFALRPGVYIEEAKQFAMTQDGRSITVTFPLLNTGSYEEISRNWQLLYGLVYQNRPGRITKTLVDIPVMYEAFIEGMLYMPYSYITGIKVDFLGNRRTMGINLPVVGSDGDGAGKKINTVIPDAFNVTITLRGLNDETRNFLYESITPGVVTSRAGDSEFSGEAEGELI
tara:strand:- start:41189 stop:42373 length:1185 start_codon:yes stop_codon:yes gene_type:complete